MLATHRLTAVIVLVGLVAACGSDGEPAPQGDDGGSAVIVTTTASPAPPSTATTAGTVDTGTVDTGTVDDGTTDDGTTDDGTTPVAPTTTMPVVGDPRVDTVGVAEFDTPVDLAVRPGDEAIYVVEQAGRVVRFVDGVSTVVADVTDRTSARGERGLLGLEFSPDGTLAYLDYTGAGDATVIAELPVAVDGAIAVDAGRILLTVDQPYGNHNAGDLEFGPDGLLYVTLGDGGSADDPQRRASDPTSLLGSLLRIDPTPSGDLPYSIPPDNPFVDGEHDGVSGAPEVFAWGLRNPWKIAFDPVTGDLWIADVGQNELEEIDLVRPVDGRPAGWGANFGWSAFEGTERFNTDVPDPGDTVMPVLTYRHGSDGCSISGGVPYRGTAIPELAPAYVYSDYCSGKLWALDLAGGRNLTLLEGFSSVTAVRTGPDGEIYVLEAGGTVHRLVPA